MNDIKNFLKACDLFGTTFTFKYKNKEKYQTSLGGLFNILFILLTIFIGIYYFIPFCYRKNYSIVYYTMSLSSTEKVSFQEAQTNIAVGLTCEGNPNEKISFSDLLTLTVRYNKYVKKMDGSFHKNRYVLNMHQCTYSDFYDKYNKQFDYLGLNKYYCFDDNNYSIEGG